MVGMQDRLVRWGEGGYGCKIGPSGVCGGGMIGMPDRPVRWGEGGYDRHAR